MGLHDVGSGDEPLLEHALHKDRSVLAEVRAGLHLGVQTDRVQYRLQTDGQSAMPLFEIVGAAATVLVPDQLRVCEIVKAASRADKVRPCRRSGDKDKGQQGKRQVSHACVLWPGRAGSRAGRQTIAIAWDSRVFPQNGLVLRGRPDIGRRYDVFGDRAEPVCRHAACQPLVVGKSLTRPHNRSRPSHARKRGFMRGVQSHARAAGRCRPPGASHAPGVRGYLRARPAVEGRSRPAPGRGLGPRLTNICRVNSIESMTDNSSGSGSAR